MTRAVAKEEKGLPLRGLFSYGEGDVLRMETLSIERLAALLREAESAHAEFETQLGHRDDDWPTWYAGYILERVA